MRTKVAEMPVAEFTVYAPSDRRYAAATAACACGSGILGSRPDDAGVNPRGPTRAPMMNMILGFIYGVALLGDSAAR